MIMKARQIEVTKKTVQGERVRAKGRITKPIDLVLEGKVVGWLVPPGELSDAEKEQVLREGWEVVEEARARNKGVSEREIAKVVNAAVKRVRAQTKRSPQSRLQTSPFAGPSLPGGEIPARG